MIQWAVVGQNMWTKWSMKTGNALLKNDEVYYLNIHTNERRAVLD